jgi:choline/glycine/proline betaine transport protein
LSTETHPARLNPRVFYPSSFAILALLIFAFISPNLAATVFNNVQRAIVENGSWFYVLSVAVILVVVLFLGISRYGDVKLGPDHATPDFSLLTWLSMLFAAGMGIGLMFFGVAEPLMHFIAPPNAEGGTIQAARDAMKTTFFHWGLHAWAIYALVALVLAYFCYRHGLPLTLRSALYPLIGDRIHGWIGHTVDVFAVTSTIFGVATSLGIGASQINSGLAYLFGIDISNTNQIMLMAGIIAIAVVSVVSGLDKGIRRLSETNMVLAVALLVFVLVLGPTVFLLQAYLQNTGAYLADIVRNTFNLFAYQKTDWFGGWTIFYWGWWIAWAPFVGLFIARISRGRTIREFVFGVLLLPTAFTLFWMTVFGNSAIDLVFNQGQNTLAEMVNENTSVALFIFLDQYPFANTLSLIAVGMIVIFFVTSCDSGAMVVDMLCSHGSNQTPVWQRIYWAVGVGVVAVVLMSAGGLEALQTMTIAAALPFAIILLIALGGLIKALRVESFKQESLQFNAIPLHPAGNSDSWQERLKTIIDFPNRKSVDVFIDKTVAAAFDSIKQEFIANKIDVDVSRSDKSIVIKVKQGDEQDFVYGVYRKKHAQPDFATDTEMLDSDDEQTYYRAEVHLREGGQDYDIMGWSKIAVINDVVDQYHKHLHFLHLLR